MHALSLAHNLTKPTYFHVDIYVQQSLEEETHLKLDNKA